MSHKFENLEDFVKSYFRKKLGSFLEGVKEKNLRLEAFEKTQKLHALFIKPQDQLEHYRGYFRALIDHLDSVVIPNLRTLKVKNQEFKNYILKDCIDEFYRFYHKELTDFLNLPIDVDKKNYFELYADALKAKMNEEIFGY